MFPGTNITRSFYVLIKKGLRMGLCTHIKERVQF